MDAIIKEINDFIHIQTVLVTIIETESNGVKQNPSTLHHWHQTEPTSVAIPITVSTEDLEGVSGFHDHGIVTVLLSTDQPSRQELHALLSNSVQGLKARGLVQNDASINEAVINQLLDYLRTSSLDTDTPGLQLPVKLYSISIASLTPGALFCEETIWKWSKPSSLYRTSGLWTKAFSETVVDGRWNTGSSFDLLVTGVSKEQKEILFEDGSRPVIIPFKFRESAK